MLSAFTLTFISLTAPVPAVDQAALKKEQTAAWADLEKEEFTAARAMLKFANRPSDSVTFFKSMLTPLKINEAAVKKGIEDLSSDDDKVWKAAYEKFRYYDPRLALSLQTVFDLSRPGNGRLRLVVVLGDHDLELFIKGHGEGPIRLVKTKGTESYSFTNPKSSWSVESEVKLLTRHTWYGKSLWTRANRAIILLEHIGTPQAVEILQSMATGHPEASPTVNAKEALVRLNKK